MLMASGANFGFRRTLPHMLGIGIGFPTMMFLVGIGVMQVFDLWPLSYTILKFFSVALPAISGVEDRQCGPAQRGRGGLVSHLTFLQSAAFQWVNPKAWSMALSAITLYASSRDLPAVIWVAGVYVCVSFLSTTGWTVLGQQMRRLLKNPSRLRVFNALMALLLVATLIPVLWPDAEG